MLPTVIRRIPDFIDGHYLAGNREYMKAADKLRDEKFYVEDIRAILKRINKKEATNQYRFTITIS